MILRSNFKEFVLGLADSYKYKLLLDDDHEYLFIEFESYGSVTGFTLTNDNEGIYQDIVSNEEEWSGMEYLLQVQELVDIIKEDSSYEEFIKDYIYSKWTAPNAPSKGRHELDKIEELYVEIIKEKYEQSPQDFFEFYRDNLCDKWSGGYEYDCYHIKDWYEVLEG